MSSENIIDVEFEADKYYTLDDVVKITGLSEAKITFYCSKLKEFLNIQSIGMYQIFSATDIDNLNRIKDLELQRGMTLAEIKKHLKSGGQEVLSKKEEDKIDVSFLEFFARILEAQDSKIDQMISVNKQLIEVINHNNSSNLKLLENSNSMQEDIKNTVAQTVEDKMNNFMNEVKEEIKSSYVSKEEIESLKNKRSLFGWLRK